MEKLQAETHDEGIFKNEKMGKFLVKLKCQNHEYNQIAFIFIFQFGFNNK